MIKTPCIEEQYKTFIENRKKNTGCRIEQLKFQKRVLLRKKCNIFQNIFKVNIKMHKIDRNEL